MAAFAPDGLELKASSMMVVPFEEGMSCSRCSTGLMRAMPRAISGMLMPSFSAQQAARTMF